MEITFIIGLTVIYWIVKLCLKLKGVDTYQPNYINESASAIAKFDNVDIATAESIAAQNKANRINSEILQELKKKQ